MKPLLAIISSNPDEPVKGLVLGFVGQYLRVSMLPRSGERLLDQHPQLRGRSLYIRFVSEYWHETPPLRCTVQRADESEGLLQLLVAFRDWGALAEFWGRELHWVVGKPH